MKFNPWKKGSFRPTPDLKLFGTDFGNGEKDQQYFPINEDFDRYRENKKSVDLSHHLLRDGLSAEHDEFFAFWILGQFAKEHPSLVSVDQGVIKFAHTGDSFLAKEFGLAEMALQVQEDIALVRVQNGQDKLVFTHICASSHWAPADKIGQSFFDIHVSVPHFEAVNNVASRLMQQCLIKGPFVRFVWGIENSDRLNQHPIVADKRPVDPRLPLYLRTERQVLLGFPAKGMLLFTILVQHQKWEEADKTGLRESLLSMTPEDREYKGLTKDFEKLTNFY
jgi:dimethylamine monooxygenase subunit A